MGRDIKKRRKLIDDQELQLRRGKEKNKCDCPHTKHGELDVIPTKNGGPLQYVCHACTKEINFAKIPERSETRDGKIVIGLADACETVDNAIDTIKITLDLNNEKDKKMLDELSGIQYRVRNQITKLYGKALSKNGSNRKKNNNNYQDSSWNKPQMNR